jgi:uncharacterized membrane protein YsdA (DUF1294 family)
MRRKPTTSPHLLSLMFSLGVPAFITTAWSQGMGVGPLPVWLISVNLMLLTLMGKDKFAAGRPGWSRTPEFTLLTLTFLGATPAMFLGRVLFRHKTKKEEFNAALYGAITAQLISIYLLRNQLLQWF